MCFDVQYTMVYVVLFDLVFAKYFAISKDDKLTVLRFLGMNAGSLSYEKVLTTAVSEMSHVPCFMQLLFVNVWKSI